MDENDTYHQIQKLKNEGIDVIVGGLLQTHYARELGLPAVRIELTDKSLSYACQEAEKLIATVKAATRKAEELKTCLLYTSRGIRGRRMRQGYAFGQGAGGLGYYHQRPAGAGKGGKIGRAHV